MKKLILIIVLFLSLCIPWTQLRAQVLFSEGFEGGTMPTDWTSEGDGTWSVAAGVGGYPSSAYAGTYNAKITHSSSGDVTKLITPEIDLYGKSSVTLTFAYVNYSWSGSIDKLKIYYRSSPYDSWHQIDYISTAHSSWTTAEYTLTQDLTNQFQLAFEMNDDWGRGIGIDDVKIEAPAACQVLKTLTATATRTSVTANWTLKNGVENCEGFEVKLSSSSDPDDEGIKTQVINNPATLTHTFEHLDRETQYYIHARVNCGTTDDYSAWSTTVVTTKALNDCNKIGDGNVSTGMPNSSYGSTYFQQIFTASELLAQGVSAGPIKGITFTWSATNSVSKNMTIWMGQTEKETFSSTTDWESSSVFSQCFYTSATTFTAGTTTYQFPTPFVWDGISNIIIASAINNGSSSGFTSIGTNCGAARSCYMYKDNYQYGIDPTVTSEYANAYRLTNRSNIAFCQTFEACPAVKNVTISDSTQTTANISWTAATGDYANDYDVLVSTTPVTDFSAVIPRHTGLTSTTDTLQGLSPYTDYYVYVRVNCNAHGHNDSLAWSEAAYFKTLSNCITPSNLAMELRGKTTGMVTWTGTTQAHNYRYILSTTEVADPDNAPTTATSIAADSVLLTGLTPGTHYYFYLSNACGGSDGNSPYMLLEFTTPDACIAPEDVTITDIQKYQMTLTWTASTLADPTDSYDIIVSPTQVTEFEGVVPTYTGVTGNSKVLDSLQRNTEYYVYIRTNCSETSKTNYTEVIAKTKGLDSPCKQADLIYGTSTISNMPLFSNYKNDYSVQIVTAAELTGLGFVEGSEITSIAYYLASSGSTTVASKYNKTVSVWIAPTTKSAFTGTSDFITTGLVKVLTDSIVSFNTINNWVSIPFQTSYIWDGQNNIAIAVLTTGSDYTTNSFRGDDAGSVRGIYYRSDYTITVTNGVPSASSSSAGTVSDVPNIKIGFCNEASACPALKNAPTSSNITNTNATLTWNTGKGDWASSYAIYRSTTEITDFTGITPTVDNIADTTYTFTDLTANTHYYMYVRVNCKNAKYDDGSSLWSPACEFTTELKCLRPTDFVAGNPTSNSVPLRWVRRNSETNWNIEARTIKSVQTIPVSSTDCSIVNDTVSYTLADLNPATQYCLYLQSNCGVDSLSKLAADTVIFFTLNNATDIDTIVVTTPFSEVVNYVSDKSAKTINLTLRKGINLSSVKFFVKYKDLLHCYGKVGNEDFSSPWDFTSPVTVRVFAQDTLVYADWTITMTEEACATPYNFNVPDSTIQRRSAILNWKIDDTATDFDLVVSLTELTDPSTDSIRNITAENNEGACSYNLTKLDRDSTYYVYVRTNCGTEFGQWRGTSFTTPGLMVCENVVVNNGTVISNDVPLHGASFYSSYNNYKNQFIYTSDKLESLRGKSIGKMTFFAESTYSSFYDSEVEVRIGVTTANDLSSAYDAEPALVVYSDVINMAENKWTIDFGTNKFDYPATGGNLIVQIKKTVTDGDWFTTKFYGTTGNTGLCRYSEYSSEYSYSFLPKVEFETCEEANACPDIKAIRTSEVETNKLTVSWTKTTGDYPGTSEIKVSKTQYSDPATEITSADYTTVDTLYEIEGLEEYTHYYIYLRTHCNGEGKEDGWTNWIMTDTITESACEYPRSVAAVMTGKNTARLSWTNSIGVLFGDETYEYAYSTVEAEPTSGTPSNEGYADLTGLANSTTYYCYVRQDCGEGSKSPWVKTTITTVPAMPAVINLKDTMVSYNAFTATWESDTALFANETQWDVCVVPTGGTPTIWETVDSREYFALGLNEETPYDIYVRAKNGSEYSEVEYITVTTTGLPSDCKTIGTGAVTQNGAISAGYGYERYVILYTAADGLTEGTIESLSLHLTTAGKNIPTKVYLKNTSLTDISSIYASSFNNAISDATLVYDETVTTIDGWLTLDITDFEYTGDNLMVITATNYGSNGGAYVNSYYTQSGSNNFCYVRKDYSIDDNTNMSSFSTTGLNNNRPNIEFCFAPESCRKPYNIVVDQITTTTARVHWYPGSDDIAWEYYVSTEELTQDQLWVIWRGGGSEGTMPALEPVVNLEDLTKDMDYYFYVSRECTDDTVFASTSFQTLPTCSAPITAQADNTGDNEITFDATFGQYGTVGSYDFWYWKVGTTDTVKVNGQVSQIIETNVPGGDYDWQVRANCGDVDGMSRWTAGNRVRVCGSFALPYAQGFEDVPTSYSVGMLNAICWEDLNASTNSKPTLYAVIDDKTEGSKSLKFFSSTTADLYVIMPQFANAANYRVNVDYKVENSKYSSKFAIGYITDPTDESTFIGIDTLEAVTSWKNNTSYLHGVPAGARLAIGYVDAIANDYYGWLDNISVGTIPVYNVASAIAPADPVLGSLTMECAAIDTVSAGRFYENAKPVFTATPNTGMKFTNWTNGNNGDTIGTVNPWTIKVTADTSIIANFDTASFNLNVNIASGSESYGTVSGSGNFKYLSENKVTATANNHYHVIWNDGNRDASRTITMPAKDTTLTATFAIDSFTVTTTQNVDSMGTITGAGSYPYGATATITATPAAHHHFYEWSNGEITPQINVEVVKDSTLHATFRLDTVYVTAISNDDNKGQVSGYGYHGYNRPVTLIAHREPHFHVKNWSNGMTGDTIVIYPTKDTTITCYFVVDSFQVTIDRNVDSMGTVTGTGTYAYLDLVIPTATPADHHHFVNWSNGKTDNSFWYEVEDRDTTFTANFAIDQHTITPVSNDINRGTVSGGGTANYGDTVTIIAKGIDPYQFARWENGSSSFTDDTLRVKVLGDETYTAYFKYNEYDVTVLSNNTSMGTVTGSGMYTWNTIDTITATPAANHHFIRWSNGSTDNPIYLTVTQDTTLTGYFGIDSFNINAVANNTTMGQVIGAGVYEYNTPVTLVAKPGAQYHFTGWSNGMTNDTITVNATADMTLVANFAIDRYTLTVVANDPNLGTATGSGEYDYGSVVPMTATPANDHVSFVGWEYQGTIASLNNPEDFYVSTEMNDTVIAVFAYDNHTVTANAGNGGTTTGSDTYLHGSVATLTAIPDDHYHFINWTDANNQEVSTLPTISFHVNKDTIVNANFEIDTHNVTLNVNDVAAGSVEGNGTYNYGTPVTIIAVPAVHHVFVGWSNGLTTDTAVITLAGDTTVTAIFAVDEHTITLNVNDPAMGTVDGTGTYTHGVQAAISATPAAHYHFVDWSNGLTANPVNILVDQDSTITANFAIDQHNVALAVNGLDMGAVEGDGTYDYGTQVTVIATPAPHYVFQQWNNGETSDTLVIDLVSDTMLIAYFTLDAHDITLDVNDPAMGTVDGADTYVHGSFADISAIANAHYHFVNWSNGITTANASIYVDRDSSITANFAIDQHNVALAVNGLDMGAVEGDGTYDYGTQVTVIATPAPHYVFQQWNNGETSDTLVIDLVSDTMLVAYFTLDAHDITLDVNDPAMGTVDGADTYVHGSFADISATANAHYHFVNWSNGITTANASIYVDRDSSITANFAIDQHNVALAVNGLDMGAVEGDGTYDYGTQVTVIATPAPHYVFQQWNNGETSDTLVIDLVSDTMLVAYFTLDAHDIALDVNDPAMGTVDGADTYVHGSFADISATANAHYHFVNWSNGITTANASIYVDRDSTITANFAIDMHTVTLGRNSVDMGSVTGMGTYAYGTQVTIVATPNDHYRFIKWSNGETNDTLVINLVGDTIINAIFDRDVHNVTLNANDPAWGTVDGDGEYLHGTFATISATPATHYHFVDWSNGLTAATERIYIEQDSTVTANFEIDEHMLAVMVDDKTHGTVTGTGFYDYGSNITITATPAPHYVFDHWSNGTTTPTTVINLVKDTVITAYFVVDSHTISLKVNNTSLGTVEGAGVYTHGDVATIIAKPFAHYHLVDWSNGLTTDTAQILVSQDSTITANFAIDEHSLTVNVDDATMGTVSGTGVYDYATLVTITATPAPHCIFSHWSTGATTATTVVNLTEDSVVTAYFVVDAHVITLNVNNPGMGSVAGAGTYTHGATAAISATPAAHYHFVDWSNGITTETANIIVDRDSLIIANFEVDEHTVSAVSSDLSKGSVTGSGIFTYGSVADLNATPAAHYRFTGWSNGATDAYQSIIVESDTIVIANFDIDQHNVTVNVDNNQGVVTGSGMYDYGSQVVVTATPLNSHYRFIGWSNGVTTATMTIDLVSDTAVTALFAIDSHVVTLHVNNSGLGSVSGAGTFTHGATARLYAFAKSNSHFVQWSNGLTSAAINITVESDTTLTAIFALNDYTLTAMPNDPSMGGVVGSGVYEYGKTANLYAFANDHYHFTGWSNGVTTPAMSIVVYGDTTVVAQFEVDQYSVTGIANDPTIGQVTGSGLYGYGETATLTAIPAPNSTFAGWSNGDTSLVTQFVVTEDVSVVAIFSINKHTVTATADDPNAGYVIGSGIYNYGSTVSLMAIANEHYHFVGWNTGDTTATISVTVNHDINVVAFFAPDEYEVSIIVNGAGSAFGDGVYTYGDAVTLIAVPDRGYRFVSWGDGSTDSVYTFTISSDVTITATFEQIPTGVEDVEVLNYVAFTEDHHIIVHGAADHRISVYDMAGRLIKVVTVATEDERFDVHVSGVYMIQVDTLPATRVIVK